MMPLPDATAREALIYSKLKQVNVNLNEIDKAALL
jgi:hypothetical protein